MSYCVCGRLGFGVFQIARPPQDLHAVFCASDHHPNCVKTHSCAVSVLNDCGLCDRFLRKSHALVARFWTLTIVMSSWVNGGGGGA